MFSLFCNYRKVEIMIQAMLAIVIFCVISFGYLLVFSAAVVFWPITLILVIICWDDIKEGCKKGWKAAKAEEARSKLPIVLGKQYRKEDY